MNRRLIVPISCFAIAAPVCRAQTVIYDTLFITDNGTFDRAFGDCIGTPPDSTIYYDLQLCDDFPLAAESRITRITTDYTASTNGHNLDAVWVQFFRDVSGAPTNAPHAEYIAPPSAVTIIDLGLIATPPPNNHGTRITVNFAANPITLRPGVWWVSVQPVTIETAAWYWILRDYDTVMGSDNHGRNGGPNHTGPYGGFARALSAQYDAWTRLGSIGFRYGTVPMRIEIASACVADIDDGSGTGTPDGGVTIDDLLYFLFLYEAGDARGDLDDGSMTGTPDGGVTIDDLLFFLARYEAGC